MSLDRTIIHITGQLSNSQSIPALILVALMQPLYKPAVVRYCTAQADYCDEVSNAIKDKDPERAADLHLCAAEMRHIAHQC